MKLKTCFLVEKIIFERFLTKGSKRNMFSHVSSTLIEANLYNVSSFWQYSVIADIFIKGSPIQCKWLSAFFGTRYYKYSFTFLLFIPIEIRMFPRKFSKYIFEFFHIIWYINFYVNMFLRISQTNVKRKTHYIYLNFMFYLLNI